MRLLLAEDDESLNTSLAYQLEAAGFTVDSCQNGDDACFYGEQNIYDVILLDRMMPCMDGMDVLTSLRKKEITAPVILITALGTLQDKVDGLNLGADDYLVKPFEFEELLARIRCVTRRSPVLANHDTLNALDITFEVKEGRLSGPSGSCTLSNREAALFETMIRQKSQTISRSTLLLKVWGPDSDIEDGNLDNYIHFLRRRLKNIGSRMQIKTIRGVGYCLTEKTGT